MRESERQSCAAISAARSGSCDLAHSVSASTWRRRRRPWARDVCVWGIVVHGGGGSNVELRGGGD